MRPLSWGPSPIRISAHAPCAHRTSLSVADCLADQLNPDAVGVTKESAQAYREHGRLSFDRERR